MNVTVKPARTSAISAADVSPLSAASASGSDTASPTASAAAAAGAVRRGAELTTRDGATPRARSSKAAPRGRICARCAPRAAANGVGVARAREIGAAAPACARTCVAPKSAAGATISAARAEQMLLRLSRRAAEHARSRPPERRRRALAGADVAWRSYALRRKSARVPARRQEARWAARTQRRTPGSRSNAAALPIRDGVASSVARSADFPAHGMISTCPPLKSRRERHSWLALEGEVLDLRGRTWKPRVA